MLMKLEIFLKKKKEKLVYRWNELDITYRDFNNAIKKR